MLRCAVSVTQKLSLTGLPGACFAGESSPPPKKKLATPPKILPSQVPLFMQIMTFNRVLPPPKCTAFPPNPPGSPVLF